VRCHLLYSTKILADLILITSGLSVFYKKNCPIEIMLVGN
jgi:hypothetical protein